MTQQQLAELMDRRGYPMHWTTVAKIEKGDRYVRADELGAFADLFDVSTDALLGRATNGGDVMWAASKLTTNAQKMISDLVTLQERVVGDAGDLQHYAERENRTKQMGPIIDYANAATALLEAARTAVAKLAGEFPLPGVNLDRT